MKKTQPLVDIDSKYREHEIDLEKKWEAGELDNTWGGGRSAKRADAVEDGGVWCSACALIFSSVVAHLQFDFIGQKSYSKQTVYDAHLTSKKHVKAVAKQATSDEPPQNPNGAPIPKPANGPTSSSPGFRNVARLTYLTAFLLVELAPILNETKSNVERRFSLTAREREQELLERSNPVAPLANTGDNTGGEEEEEEEERIYNPLKLPLGWDGKPIPYWLYKLHGLGVEYRCEICSDHVYMGR